MTKLGEIIVQLLKRDGPMHTPAICRALDRDYAATVPIMTALLKEGAVRVVGQASKFGFKDVKSTAPVYEATGITTHLAKNERGRPHIGVSQCPPPHYTRGAFSRQRTNSGSGVIAGPITIGRGYKWGGSRA